MKMYVILNLFQDPLRNIAYVIPEFRRNIRDPYYFVLLISLVSLRTKWFIWQFVFYFILIFADTSVGEKHATHNMGRLLCFATATWWY